MSTRVPAPERTSQRLRELLGDLPDGEALSEVMKLGIRKIVDEALERRSRLHATAATTSDESAADGTKILLPRHHERRSALTHPTQPRKHP